MAARNLLLGLCLAASAVLGAPLESRAVIPHDAVVGFPETVPEGINGSLYLAYKPYLHVINGCVPFPAVDAAGNTGAGLATTGPSNGDCSSSPGQIYARAAPYNGKYAIMYTWYMPKDSPSDGLGHRHDWENVVVWLSSSSSNSSTPTPETAKVTGLAVSQHGNYFKDKIPLLSGATHPLVGYVSFWPLNHQLVADLTVGGFQPLIAWESLTDAARTALSVTDFGSARFPLKDDQFMGKVAGAEI